MSDGDRRRVLEICIDSMESAVAAVQGGADRLEVCSALPVGGLTPSYGLVRRIAERWPRLEQRSMLRSRDGDFVYSEDELSVMEEDAARLMEAGSKGLVFGALHPNGHLNVEACREVKRLAHDPPFTLHRAIDTMNEAASALCGFDTILTSGQHATASEGVHVLKEMAALAQHLGVRLMAGSGVSPSTLPALLSECGSGHSAIMDWHASASTTVPYGGAAASIAMGRAEGSARRVTSEPIVRELRRILDERPDAAA